MKNSHLSAGEVEYLMICPQIIRYSGEGHFIYLTLIIYVTVSTYSDKSLSSPFIYEYKITLAEAGEIPQQSEILQMGYIKESDVKVGLFLLSLYSIKKYYATVMKKVNFLYTITLIYIYREYISTFMDIRRNKWQEY